jgi:putative transposase
MDASFCKEALDEVITKYGPPEIMNTDQGSRFCGAAWITTLTEARVKISMDGPGAIWTTYSSNASGGL